MTPSELEGMLTFEGIRRVVALEFVQRVIKQHANIAAPSMSDTLKTVPRRIIKDQWEPLQHGPHTSSPGQEKFRPLCTPRYYTKY